MPNPGPEPRLNQPTRRSIIVEDTMWAAAKRQARAEGLSLSEWLRRLIDQALRP